MKTVISLSTLPETLGLDSASPQWEDYKYKKIPCQSALLSAGWIEESWPVTMCSGGSFFPRARFEKKVQRAPGWTSGRAQGHPDCNVRERSKRSGHSGFAWY